jgi:hypothetical protein
MPTGLKVRDRSKCAKTNMPQGKPARWRPQGALARTWVLISPSELQMRLKTKVRQDQAGIQYSDCLMFLQKQTELGSILITEVDSTGVAMTCWGLRRGYTRTGQCARALKLHAGHKSIREWLGDPANVVIGTRASALPSQSRTTSPTLRTPSCRVSPSLRAWSTAWARMTTAACCCLRSSRKPTSVCRVCCSGWDSRGGRWAWRSIPSWAWRSIPRCPRWRTASAVVATPPR